MSHIESQPRWEESVLLWRPSQPVSFYAFSSFQERIAAIQSSIMSKIASFFWSKLQKKSFLLNQKQPPIKWRQNILNFVFKRSNIIIIMYFANEAELINALDDDWSTLLKNIKNRQELHLSILTLNRNTVGKNRSEMDLEQLDLELNQIAEEVKRTKEKVSRDQQQEKQIVDKYDNLTTSFQDVIKLMSRVGARVLESTQSQLDKIRALDSSVWEKHNRMKRDLINMINQKEKMNLELLFNLVLDYSRAKVKAEVAKMVKFLSFLENKDYQKLREPMPSRDKPRMNSVERIRELMTERKKEYSLSREERGQSKRNDSSQKLKSKGIYSIYGILQLSKNQSAEDYLGCSVQEKRVRIYTDLVYRNRKNKEHIASFLKLSSQFPSKTKHFVEKLERKSCQKVRYENKSFTEIVQKKKKEHTLTQSITFNQYLTTEGQIDKKQSQEEREGELFKKRMGATKTKFFGKDGEDFPFIYNKTMMTQENQKVSQVQMVKKGSMFENKRRLPELSRGISLDNKQPPRAPKLSSSKGIFKDDINNMEEDIIKTNKRKQKWMRDDKLTTQRTKMMIKNVEVGIPLNPKKQQWLGKKQEAMKERKKTDTIETNAAYARRTLNKFMDTKMNGFI